MTSENDRRVAAALKLRDELNAERFSRRELNRMGLLAGGSYFGARPLRAQGARPDRDQPAHEAVD